MSSVATPSTFDHSSINVRNVDARRAHMKAFFIHLGLWNEEQVKVYREESEEQVSITVHNACHRQVNQVFFDFIVDQIVWYSILKQGNALGQGHDWQWTIDAVPDKKDLTAGGASVCHEQWRQRNLPHMMEDIIATGRVVNLDELYSYFNYIPMDSHIDCIFGGVSAQFPSYRIQDFNINVLRSYVLGFVEGAFPSCAKAYTSDEILALSKYKIVQGR
ncbi:hypothetical protein H9Q72_009203 [Fusarium xylarioides]|uniref:Uncharacterized protein n=1 Tax=Fusarium xylarioides TaxID=221167 RepID=A0A9P7HLX8_9HYPO|nr:hypothetical protein H9Q72_009203 [Fusarium xylarioides]